MIRPKACGHSSAGRGYQRPCAGLAQGGGDLQRAALGTARFERGQHLEHGLALQRGSGKR